MERPKNLIIPGKDQEELKFEGGFQMIKKKVPVIKIKNVKKKPDKLSQNIDNILNKPSKLMSNFDKVEQAYNQL